MAPTAKEISASIVARKSHLRLARVDDGDVLCAVCEQQPRKTGAGGLWCAVWVGAPSLHAPALLICRSCLLFGLLALDPADHF